MRRALVLATVFYATARQSNGMGGNGNGCTCSQCMAIFERAMARPARAVQ